MNVLLIYLQPKDGLDEVRKSIENIPCDKLILKYFPYPMVYKVALDTIKKHPEYTHIIWLQNDIVFNIEAFETMCTQIKSTGDSILGVSMNVDLSPKGMKLCAFSVKKFEYSVCSEMPFEPMGKHKGIIKVFHNGGPFIASREFYIKYPLRGMDKSGYNADFIHGLELHLRRIPYFLNTDIHLKHLRYKGDMMVGKKEPEVEIVRY